MFIKYSIDCPVIIRIHVEFLFNSIYHFYIYQIAYLQLIESAFGFHRTLIQKYNLVEVLRFAVAMLDVKDDF